MANRGHGSRGFTLIELALVLLIMGILATMAISTYSRMISKARMSQASIVLDHLSKTQALYFSEAGRYTNDPQILAYDPVKYDYYQITVTVDNTGQNFLGVAEGFGPMAGDRWTIDKNGIPTQDNQAKLRF